MVVVHAAPVLVCVLVETVCARVGMEFGWRVIDYVNVVLLAVFSFV